MLVRPQIDRRTFLADMGRGAFAIAIVGIVGCSPSTLASLAPTPSGATPPTGSPPPSPGADASDGPETAPPGSPGEPTALRWERVNLGFVSAYLLIRGSEVALVDTGVFDSSDEIAEALATINLGWEAVAHVIGTHNHGDHIGSIATVMQKAPAASVYMGAEDIAGVGGVTVNPVGDGDKVFDLQIVTTPGHTAGTLSFLFEVKDNGKPLRVAYVGGTAIPFDAAAAYYDGYIASARKIAKTAADFGATVLLSNHTEFDNGYYKAHTAANRKPGDANPFDVGRAAVDRYFTLVDQCSTAAKLRAAGKV
jgi:metallo-beta-lactamase class B